SVTDQTIADLAPVIGTRAACAALGRSRATYYRYHRQSPPSPRPSRKRLPQPRALSLVERAEVLGVLHQERFVDQPPASVYANLLDEGRHLCSVPTMYRLLRTEDEVRERRRQATHPATVKPELVATGQTTSGVGISPSFLVHKSGRTSTCTWSSIVSAATSSAGYWHPVKRQSWPNDSSPRRSASRTSQLTSSRF